MDAKTVTTTDWITAVSAAVSAIASVVLFIVAFVQLRGLKDQIQQSSDQERRRNTLEAVERVEHDPSLVEAYKVIWEKSGNGTDYSKTAECKYHIITILNYFEGIAIGIAQHVYMEQMARDYIEDVAKKAVEVWLIADPTDSRKPPAKMFGDKEYTEVRKLYARWFPAPSPTYNADA